MVVFTCDGCGDSVKKPQVEKHLGQCRRTTTFSCMDCCKTFHGNEYKTHIKCVSEVQKYSAKGFVAKENKGEVKQASWVEQVQAAIDGTETTNHRLVGLLNRISEFTNIPRKEAKFDKFLENSLRIFDRSLRKDAWNAIAASAKKPTTPAPAPPVAKSVKPVVATAEPNGKTNRVEDSRKRKPEDIGETSDNQNSNQPKKKKKEKGMMNGNATHENGEQKEAALNSVQGGKTKKKKTKKPQTAEDSQAKERTSEHQEANGIEGEKSIGSEELITNDQPSLVELIKRTLRDAPGMEMKVKKLRKSVSSDLGMDIGSQGFEQTLSNIKRVSIESGKIVKWNSKKKSITSEA